MRARYYPGLFDRYKPRQGSDWIKALPADDLRVFVNIGREFHDSGRMGGKALCDQRGRDYMKHIGRIGAIITNSKKAWQRAMQEEMERLGIL